MAANVCDGFASVLVVPSPKVQERPDPAVPWTLEELESKVQVRLVHVWVKAATGVVVGPSPSGPWKRNSARGEPQL